MAYLRREADNYYVKVRESLPLQGAILFFCPLGLVKKAKGKR